MVAPGGGRSWRPGWTPWNTPSGGSALGSMPGRGAGSQRRWRQCGGCGPVAGRLFDTAVTNPPIRTGKATLRRLVRDVWQHLRPGGRFYFVARMAQGARTLARDVTEVFGTVRELERKSGYRVYEAMKEVEELKS